MVPFFYCGSATRRDLRVNSFPASQEPYVSEMIIEDPQHIESFPGLGVICAATLSGEIGSTTRFNSEAGIAVYKGWQT